MVLSNPRKTWNRINGIDASKNRFDFNYPLCDGVVEIERIDANSPFYMVCQRFDADLFFMLFFKTFRLVLKPSTDEGLL